MMNANEIHKALEQNAVYQMVWLDNYRKAQLRIELNRPGAEEYMFECASMLDALEQEEDDLIDLINASQGYHE